MWARERERIFARHWVRRRARRGRARHRRRAARRRRRRVASSSCAADDGALRGFYNVCRHRGAELVGRRRAGTRSLRGADPLPVPLLDATASTARCDEPRSSTTSSRRPISACTRSASTRGAASCSSTSHRRAPAAGRAARADPRARPAATRWPSSAAGRTITYDVAANWKVIAENYNECYHCGPVHPELCDLVPGVPPGRRRPGVGRRRPAPRRRLDVHRRPARPTRAPFPALDEAERVTPQGRARLPQPAAQPVRRPRRRVRLRPTGPGRTTVVCELLFQPDALAADDFDPSDAGDFWDLVNARTGRSARACSGAWPRGRGPVAGSPRWRTTRPTSAAGTPARWAARRASTVGDRRRRHRRARRPRLVRRPTGCARRGADVVGFEQFELGHVPRRHPRPLAHHPPLVPHARLRPPGRRCVRRLASRSRTTAATAIVTVTGGIDLFPPGAAIDPDAYTSSLDAAGRAVRRARRRRRAAPLAGVRCGTVRRRRHGDPLGRDRLRRRPDGPRPRCRPGRRARRRAARAARWCASCDPSRAGSTSSTDDGSVAPRRGRSSRRRLDRTAPRRRSASPVPLTVPGSR